MLPRTIPAKLPGTVPPQYVRCGDPNCRCVCVRARGELHGPCWYRFWRDEDGRQHKQYVKKSDLGAVRAACEAGRAEQQERREALAQSAPAVEWLRIGEAHGECRVLCESCAISARPSSSACAIIWRSGSAHGGDALLCLLVC